MGKVIYYNDIRNEIYNALIVKNEKHKLQKHIGTLDRWFKVDTEGTQLSL